MEMADDGGTHLRGESLEIQGHIWCWFRSEWNVRKWTQHTDIQGY